MNGHVKIVVPCANEGKWLQVTVDSILEHTSYPSFEIFILANGDEVTDFSFVEKPAYRRRVRLKETEELLGVGRSINEAVVDGDAAYYAFLDAHCLLETKDWLERAIDCLEAHPDASMMQPEVVQFEYEGDLDSDERLDLGLVRESRRVYSIRWAWPYEHPFDISEVQINRIADTAYEAMAGGGMVVFARADTFHRLGRYDPEVGGWYPETMDYCVRAWLLGHPMLVDPTVRVLHRSKAESPGPSHGFLDVVHGYLRTAYKYLSPRRRDLAEILFRRHGLRDEVDQAMERIRRGRWISERAAHLRERIRDDDWLFARFGVYEERFGLHIP